MIYPKYPSPSCTFTAFGDNFYGYCITFALGTICSVDHLRMGYRHDRNNVHRIRVNEMADLLLSNQYGDWKVHDNKYRDMPE